MKKVLISSLLACFLYANGDMYSDVVKPIFSDKSSKNQIGRLLPTNAVKILEKDGGMLKIEVTGYQNPAVPNVIYFSDSERVLTLAFAKTAEFKTELVKKGKNGKWDLVKTQVFTSEGDFYDDVKPMLQRAEELYKTNCGMCHKLHETTHYKANQWPSLFKSMLSRTAIDKKDEWLVAQYLQKHSSDVKLK